MRIILSPAKQMVCANDYVCALTTPELAKQAQRVADYLKGLTFEQARDLWNTSEKLAVANFEQLADMDLERNVTPAVLAFDGIAYKYMAPSVFEDDQFDYVQQHLRILSGLYGVLRPLDGVVPYRLEMQARAHVEGARNLYDFWGDALYRAVADGSCLFVNLASKEYSKCIEPYLQPEDTMVTCIFGELAAGKPNKNGTTSAPKVVQKGVYAKMARGDMVRFMAEHRIEDPRDMRAYDRLGYRFDADLSTDTTYVFLRDPLINAK